MNREQVAPQNLEDAASMMAYADWLQSQGEPLGELIALDLGIEDGRTELAVARTELLAKYGAGILGDSLTRFLQAGYAKVAWQRGHIVDFEYAARGRTLYNIKIDWLLELIAKHREPFRFVQRFAFPSSNLDDVAWFTKFPTLETIEISYCEARDLMPLAALSNLVHLDVTGCVVDIGHLRALHKKMPNLTIVHEHARGL